MRLTLPCLLLLACVSPTESRAQTSSGVILTADGDSARWWITTPPIKPDSVRVFWKKQLPPPTPTVVSLTLSPDSAALIPAASRAFVALLTWSDGQSRLTPVSWTASGGTISPSGLYTAGSTAGAFQVTASAAGKAGTAKVTVTAASPPPPPTGKNFFTADAESGVVGPPWSAGWGIVSGTGGIAPVTSTVRAHSGSRSYKYEIPTPNNASYSQTLTNNPQPTMGGNGFQTGYYSFWAYVDAGYTTSSTAWNMLLGWMTAVSGAPNPISHIGLEVWNGKLQVVYYPKNCLDGFYACPAVAGYTTGEYRMTAQSPAGIVAFPRQQWVHLSIYYKMAPTNGQVTIWQDGVKIMDLTAPTMNTRDGFTTRSNTANGLLLQFGIYGGARNDGTQRLYVDDFTVTDYRPVP